MAINLKNLLKYVNGTGLTGTYDSATGLKGKLATTYAALGADKAEQLIFASEDGTGKAFYAHGVMYDIYGQRLRSAATAVAVETNTATLTTTYTREDGTDTTSTFGIKGGTGITLAATDGVLTVSFDNSALTLNREADAAAWSTILTTPDYEVPAWAEGANKLVIGDSWETDTNKLDLKIANLVKEIQDNEKAVATTFSNIATALGYGDAFAFSQTSTFFDTGVSNVKGALDKLGDAVTALQAIPTFDVIICTEAANTPAGVTFGAVTGTLAASADTMHKIYLVPETSGTGDNYSEYISVKSGETYTWEKIGTTAASLSGYVKTIKLNGKDYTPAEGTTNVDLGNVVNTVTAGTTNDFIKVEEATTGGTKTATVTAKTASVIYTASTETTDPNLTANTTNGKLLEAGAITEIKKYVDDQISILWKEITLG